MRYPDVDGINSKAYWDRRFSSGDWESKLGRKQTEYFARGQVVHLGLSADFDGTLVDFGCGLGDAIPILRNAFPRAHLVGIDLSSSAIESASARYGHLAEFIQGDDTVLLKADVIIASNVVEHLSDDESVLLSLLSKCSRLIVVVPYKEQILCNEHLRRYDEHSFRKLNPISWVRFPCFGWSQFGFNLYYQIYFKNIFRALLGMPLRRRDLQILYKFNGIMFNGEF